VAGGRERKEAEMAEDVVRRAVCACGHLSVTMQGEPMLVSSCCCTRCQRRTGSFYGVTVYYRPAQMTARAGEPSRFHRPDGETTFHFCPRCGSSVWWAPDDVTEDVIGVAGGCFADPALPSPVRMTHTATRHPYVRAPEGISTYEDGPPA